MADEVRKHNETMGETGQGFESEKRITPGTELARTWGECVPAAWYSIQMLTNLLSKADVEKVCPWYYRMKALIGERPNAKPVGIGNSASEVEVDVLTPGIRRDDFEDTEPTRLSEDDSDEEDQVDDQRRAGNKRSASVAGLDEDVKPKRGTPARPNVSKPTAVGTKPKKMKGLEELAEITAAEEATRRKELDLEIQKSKDKTSRTTAKAELQRAAIEAKKEMVKQAHEMEMMKLQLELAKIHHATPGIGTSVHLQLGQSSGVHSPVSYPAFNTGFTFGDGSQAG